MGNCCSHKFSTNNQFENLLLEIVYEIKIRKNTFIDVKETFNKSTTTQIIEDNGVLKHITFISEENYLHILKKLFIEDDIDKNPFYILQLNLFPNYNDFLLDDPEYQLLKKTSSFVFKNNISLIFDNIETLIKIRYSDLELFTFKNLFTFISEYLVFNIIDYPINILNTLETIFSFIQNKENKNNDFAISEKNIILNINSNDLTKCLTKNKNVSKSITSTYLKFENNLLDLQYLNEFKNFTKNLLKNNKIDKIIEILQDSMKKIILEENNILDFPVEDMIIKKEYFNKFIEKFLWLWDILDLMQFYFANMNDNDKEF